MNRSIISVAIIAACSIPFAAAAQVTPTSEWVSLWSGASTLNTNPIPSNAVIRVFDPDGVLCGESMVETPGSYGLVPVYGDDPFTQDIDEGAEPGDILSITINGFHAAAAGPDAAVWTENGDVLQVDLVAEGVVPTSEWISFWSSLTQVSEAPVAPGAVVRAYDPDGVLCGEFMVVLPGGYGLMPVYRDDLYTSDFDEGAEPGDIITFEIDGAEASPQGPDTPIWSANGDVKNVDLSAELVPTLLLSSNVWVEDDAVELEWTLGINVHPTQMALFRRGEHYTAFYELVHLPIRQHIGCYRATDRDAAVGTTYSYQLRVNILGITKFLDIGSARVPPPPFELLPSYPNPFRYNTTMRFGLAAPSAVTLVVYDAQGRLVRRLIDVRTYPPGTHEVLWDGLDETGNTAPVGVYFIRFRAGAFRETSKTLLLR